MVEMMPSPYAHNGVHSIPEDSAVDDVSRVAAAAVAARVLMGSSDAASHREGNAMTREEHTAMMHELSKKRAGWRTPRRGWSSTEPPIPEPPHAIKTPDTCTVDSARQQTQAVPRTPAYSRTPHPLAAQQYANRRPAAAGAPKPVPAPRYRPGMPIPRRSYSVTDYEPPSQTHPPSNRMTIADMPAELHYVIFDFLDPIDSTCLGLTNQHFYDIHRRMHGSVELSSRRDGPNDLEWAWRGAGPLVRPSPLGAATRPAPTSGSQPIHETSTLATRSGKLQRASTSPNVARVREQGSQEGKTQGEAQGQAQAQAQAREVQDLERLRVKGQVYCRKCGISRCELHRHLKEWMGPRYEYCSVSARYGPLAPEGAREFCYLKSPKKPHRCGRHAGKTVSATASAGGTGSHTPVVAESQESVVGSASE